MFKTFALFLVLGLVSVQAIDFTSIDCSAEKLVPNDDFSALSETLEIVRKEPVGRIYSSTVAGLKVWARAKCLSPGDCSGCVSQLIDNVWAECENSRAADVSAPDCSLKYDFSEF